jgi:enoyl-CoA hydratase
MPLNDTDGDVLFRVEDGIAWITLNRPARRNAISIAVAERLHAIWEQVDADAAVRVAILTSADCGTFCAGMDLKEAAEVRRDRGIDILQLIKDPFHERMRAVSKPVIAAMTGHFAAGGMMLTLNADLPHWSRRHVGGITEVQRGRGSPWAVPMLWMVPQPILLEMMLTGDMISIERLHHLGFINYVERSPEAVRARAVALAHRIRDNAPLSVVAAKGSIIAAMSLGCNAGLAEAKRLHEPVYASEDAQEGPRAFAEKRAPRWRGR